MIVITEQYLRSRYRQQPFTSLVVEEGQIVTPSATQFLNERRIQLERATGSSSPDQPPPLVTMKQNSERQADVDSSEQCRMRYVSAADGSWFASKPESMTQLHGNRLVAKDHPRIILRGRLDHFQSMLLKVQAEAYGAGKKEMTAALGEILNQVRSIVKAEVLNQPLPPTALFGLESERLRDLSHHPKKHFGIDHLLPDHTMSRLVLDLNLLRSQIREVELVAVTAFHKEDGVERLDIIEALNRLSSAIYVLMILEHSGKISDLLR